MLANNQPEQIITWSTKKNNNKKLKKTGDKGATPLNLQEKKCFPHEVMKIYPEGFLKPVFRELTRLLYVDKRLSLDCGKKHEYSGRTCKPSQMMESNPGPTGFESTGPITLCVGLVFNLSPIFALS